jgi:hypothetical protein
MSTKRAKQYRRGLDPEEQIVAALSKELFKDGSGIP